MTEISALFLEKTGKKSAFFRKKRIFASYS